MAWPAPANRATPILPVTRDGKVKHSSECYDRNGGDASDPYNCPGDFRQIRKNPTPGCARCAEMSAGAESRKGGW